MVTASTKKNGRARTGATTRWRARGVMLPPVRCFTCNALVSAKWYQMTEQMHQGAAQEDALNATGLKRYCCRRMLMTSVDLSDVLLSPHTDLHAELENMTLDCASRFDRTISTH